MQATNVIFSFLVAILIIKKQCEKKQCEINFKVYINADV